MGDKASTECSLQEEEEDHVLTQLALFLRDSANDRTMDTPTGQVSEALEEIYTSGTTSRTALMASTTVLSVAAIDTTFSLSTLSSVLAQAVRLPLDGWMKSPPSRLSWPRKMQFLRQTFSNAPGPGPWQSAKEFEGLGETHWYASGFGPPSRPPPTDPGPLFDDRSGGIHFRLQNNFITSLTRSIYLWLPLAAESYSY